MRRYSAYFGIAEPKRVNLMRRSLGARRATTLYFAGTVTMPDEQEDSWRRDFELWGHDAVRQKVTATNGWDKLRRQAAFRWLREKESENERRERQMRHDMRRMLRLIVAAIGLASVSVFVALIALLM
jgi:hypothetical protein